MSPNDYAHWNEEARRVWWEEEGKHDVDQDSDDDWYDDEKPWSNK